MVSFRKSYSSIRGYSMSFAAFFTCSTSLHRGLVPVAGQVVDCWGHNRYYHEVVDTSPSAMGDAVVVVVVISQQAIWNQYPWLSDGDDIVADVFVFW